MISSRIALACFTTWSFLAAIASGHPMSSSLSKEQLAQYNGTDTLSRATMTILIFASFELGTSADMCIYQRARLLVKKIMVQFPGAMWSLLRNVKDGWRRKIPPETHRTNSHPKTPYWGTSKHKPWTAIHRLGWETWNQTQEIYSFAISVFLQFQSIILGLKAMNSVTHTRGTRTMFDIVFQVSITPRIFELCIPTDHKSL